MLPSLTGKLKTNFVLRDQAFFKVGGPCDIFFSPHDLDDLKKFLRNIQNIEIICLGAMSNVLIPDSGFRGCVISTQKAFDKVEFFAPNRVKVGSGSSISNFIKTCIKMEYSCCEQMFCIPGTIGGALIMNAGTPSFEIFDPLIEIQCIDLRGNHKTLLKKDIEYTYRNGNIPKDLIITSCILETSSYPKRDLENIINKIKKDRFQSQPMSLATCGSTFKNPDGKKAWQLIDSAGCRGMRCGGAVLSNLHCNFIINEGNATSNDILNLIEKVKKRVFERHKILLEEEIKIIGSKK